MKKKLTISVATTLLMIMSLSFILMSCSKQVTGSDFVAAATPGRTYKQVTSKIGRPAKKEADEKNIYVFSWKSIEKDFYYLALFSKTDKKEDSRVIAALPFPLKKEQIKKEIQTLKKKYRN